MHQVVVFRKVQGIWNRAPDRGIGASLVVMSSWSAGLLGGQQSSDGPVPLLVQQGASCYCCSGTARQWCYPGGDKGKYVTKWISGAVAGGTTESW